MITMHIPSKGRTARSRRATRLLPGILLAASIAAAGSLVTAGPAAAEAGDCSFVKTVCLYSGENFTGERITLSSLQPSGTCVNLAESGWALEVNSVINTHSSSASMFSNADCVGGPYQVAGNSGISQLGSFTPVSVWVAG